MQENFALPTFWLWCSPSILLACPVKKKPFSVALTVLCHCRAASNGGPFWGTAASTDLIIVLSFSFSLPPFRFSAMGIGILQITHPSGCFSPFLQYFGENVFVLWRMALLKRRILLVSSPPVGLLCYRGQLAFGFQLVKTVKLCWSLYGGKGAVSKLQIDGEDAIITIRWCIKFVWRWMWKANTCIHLISMRLTNLSTLLELWQIEINMSVIQFNITKWKVLWVKE